MTRRDRGSILPIVAFSMIALLIMVAIVIDLGATRSQRRDARSASDAGATAGAVALGGATNAIAACSDALYYTYENLGGTMPTSATITSACAGFSATCTTDTGARTATVTVGSTTVTVTNPVTDGSTLMQGTSLGSGVAQTVDQTYDGKPCDRVGVQVTRTQPSFFRGVFTSTSATYTVHSVARYSTTVRPGLIPPALVALNRTTCAAIDAGNNGNIVLRANANGPGIAYADSDGSAGSCTGSSAILQSRSSARLFAESSGTTTGVLGWYSAASTSGYNNSSTVTSTTPATWPTTSGNYVGSLQVRSARTTRVPVDQAYHCQNVPTTVQALCASSTDPVLALQALATSSSPAGYTVYSGPCDTTAGSVTMSGQVWVRDCPLFTVKGGTLNIAAGSSVIFAGSLSVQAGGTLLSNTTGGTDANGYPVATDSSRPTTIVLDGTGTSTLDMQSTSSVISMAETTVYSQGGLSMQGSPVLRWTPPSTGLLKGLIYWSESTQTFSIQGGPLIFAKGVVFHGNGQLLGGGGGTINLTNVQMWVDTARTSGSTTVMLAADPTNSIKTSSAGSALIR